MEGTGGRGAKSMGSRSTETMGGGGATRPEGRRTTVMAGDRRREKMVGRVGCTKTAEMDGGGELKEWWKPKRRGQRSLGVLRARGSVYMARVSFVFLMSKFL